MRYVEAGTGCSVQVLDYEANDKFISCELGISPDCTEDAVVLLQGPFWDWMSAIGARSSAAN